MSLGFDYIALKFTYMYILQLVPLLKNSSLHYIFDYKFVFLDLNLIKYCICLSLNIFFLIYFQSYTLQINFLVFKKAILLFQFFDCPLKL